ncbi:MAG: response regulator transcription factor [Firmicutes bacterium]|nr:response regulator transcription factor [Bacillota bacterium]
MKVKNNKRDNHNDLEKIKILIVDDDPEITDLLVRYLEVEGYLVDKAYNGSDALELFKKNVYDMVITDIMMPGLDGLDLLKKIRELHNPIIILLTAKDKEVDRVIGLKSGADDYVVKPFYMNELIARIESHLRRYNLDKERIEKLIFNNLIIDTTKAIVKKGGREVKLRAKEYELLVFLSKNESQVFSKGQIFKNVWKDEYYEDDNTVMVHIRRLRSKIEDDPSNPKIIKTVWGLGYKFVGNCK